MEENEKSYNRFEWVNEVLIAIKISSLWVVKIGSQRYEIVLNRLGREIGFL